MREMGRLLVLLLLSVTLVACGGSSSGKSKDTTAPVITLTGDNPQVIEAGGAYVELGATAIDNRDGDLSNAIVIDATAVDTMVAGDYTVTYDVSDAAGNAAATVMRTVRVELPPPPAAPVVSVEGETKRLIFRWDAIASATHYRLLENADGHSGFTEVGGDIPGGETSVNMSIAAHLHDWANALYIVQACNLGGCTNSVETSATSTMLNSIGYFKASNTEAFDGFGDSVALSNDGRTMVVGAPREDGDEPVAGSGAAYVFRFDGSIWSQQAYIKASNPGDGHFFGDAVDISGDGKTLAVGGPQENSLQIPEDPVAQGAGAVYIFRLENSAWTEQAMLKPAYYGGGPQFGTTLSLSADGNRVAIGAPFDDMCATGVNGEIQGNCVDSGAAYVFDFDGALWRQQAYIKGGKTWDDVHFGAGVFLSDSGSMLAVNAPLELRLDLAPFNIGTGYTFRFDGSHWVADAVFAPFDGSDNLSFNLTGISDDGTTVSARLGKEVSAGEPPTWETTLQVFRRGALEWVEEIAHQRLGPIGYCYYCNAALSADGNVIVVGSRDDSNAVGIDGDRQNSSAHRSGAVDVFQFDGLTWQQSSYVKASNTEAMDWFGQSIALSADGDTLAVGAEGEDSSATGINGDQSDNSAERAGAVYVY